MFAHGYGVQIVLQGFMFGLLTLVAFWIGTGYSFTELANGALATDKTALSAGQTMAFIVLAFSQIVQAFNMRSGRSLLRLNPFSNKMLNLAALATVLLTVLLLFTPVRIAFGLVLLQPTMYLIAVGLFMIPFVVMEIAKALGLIKSHHKN